MPPIIYDSESYEYDSLMCPCCNGQWLHHDKVVIENRIKEDEDGYEITVVGETAIKKKKESRKIRNRRDNIYIHFYCELCSPEGLPFVFCIYQHKGFTKMEWVHESKLN